MGSTLVPDRGATVGPLEGSVVVVLGSRCLIQFLPNGEIFWIAVARLNAIDAICSACLDPRAESRG